MSKLQGLEGLRVKQERHDADEGHAFLAHPRLLVGVARHDDFAKPVVHMGERKDFLLALGLIGNLPDGLDINAFRITVDHEVNFVLSLFALAVFVFSARFDYADIDGIAAPDQLVVNDVLHQVGRLVLAKVHLDVAQSGILSIVFDGKIKVVLPLDIVSCSFFDEKGVAEMIKVFGCRDGVRRKLCSTGDGVRQFRRIREASDIAHHDVEKRVHKRFVPDFVAFLDVAQIDSLAEVAQVVAFRAFVGFQDAVGQPAVHQIFAKNGFEVGDRFAKREEFGHRKGEDANLLAASAKSRCHVARQHFRVRSSHIAVHQRCRAQLVQNVVKGRVAVLSIIGMNARKVDVGIQCFLAILNFVNENIVCFSVEYETFLNVSKKSVGGAEVFRRVLFKVNIDDVVGRNANIKQMPLEQLEEEITFPTTSNTCDNFDEIVMFGCDNPVKVQISTDCHSCSPVLFSVDEASYFKAGELYHNFRASAIAIIFHFSRHFFASRRKYVVESMKMEETETASNDERFDFHLDPNRIRTNAEIQLFADVFEISVEEARQILMKAGRRCEA